MAAETRINCYSDLLVVSGLPPASLLRIVTEATLPSTPGRYRLPVEVGAGVVHLLANPHLIPSLDVAVRGLRIGPVNQPLKEAVFGSVRSAAEFLALQDRTVLSTCSAEDASSVVAFLAQLVVADTNVRMLKPRSRPGIGCDLNLVAAVRAHDKAAEALARIDDEFRAHQAGAEKNKKADIARAHKKARTVVVQFRERLEKAAKAYFMHDKRKPPTKQGFHLFVLKVVDLWAEAVSEFAGGVDQPRDGADPGVWTAPLSGPKIELVPPLRWRDNIGMLLRSVIRMRVCTFLAAAGAVPAAQLAGYDTGLLSVPLAYLPYAGWAGIAAICSLLWSGWNWLTAGRASQSLVDRLMAHFDSKAPDLEKMLIEAYEEMANAAVETSNKLMKASLTPESKLMCDIQEMAGAMSKDALISKGVSSGGRFSGQSHRAA